MTTAAASPQTPAGLWASSLRPSSAGSQPARPPSPEAEQRILGEAQAAEDDGPSGPVLGPADRHRPGGRAPAGVRIPVAPLRRRGGAEGQRRGLHRSRRPSCP